MGDPLGSEEASLATETGIKSDLCLEIDPPPTETVATAEDWRRALGKVVPAVVVLRTTACRAFDTVSAGASYATGFIVDKRRGIILTNRHVVKPGPVVAEAMFVNREEIPIYPVYRDPVHDFGFFSYDPSAVQFLSYEEIPLAPEAASVGLEIRVVGNDSGEKVSILAGTLARLDRDAPQYKKDGYNDFNTFYMQAASGTKGGSSGSPVIDWQGRAVALNAGSKSSSASAFFLPLQRVVRALSFLQKSIDSCTDKPKAVHIPRGTLQMTFVHKGFDEIRRLGLRSETEQVVRHASPTGETGMLVVDSVVPNGPADKHLEPGDVLIRVNGTVLTQFLNLENLIDDGVGQIVELEIERGGQPITVSVSVQDLHSITPDHFLEVSGAVIHPLSYQQARNFRFPCGLAYVSDPGYMLFRAGVPRHAIIKKVANEDISCLADLISVLSKLSRGARVPLEYMSHTDRHRKKSVLVTIDRHEWYAPPQLYTRNDSSGLWDVKPAIEPAAVPPSIGNSGLPICQNTESMHEVVRGVTDTAATMEASSGDGSSQNDFGVEAKKQRVEDDSSDGTVANGSLHGSELKSDDAMATENSVLRDYESAAALSANASLAERAIEPALVMFEVKINIMFVKLMGRVHVAMSLLKTEPALQRGDSVYLVGLSRNLQATSRKSIVTNPCAALNIGSADSPRYRATNMEVIELDTDFGSSFSGALTDEQGRIRAIWGSFSTQVKYSSSSSEDHQFVRGIPIYAISQVLEKIITGGNGPELLINGVKRPMPLVRILEVELYPTLLSKARSFGLSDEWIQILVKKDPVRRQVLRVKGCLAGSKAENLLEQGDMVLAVNKMPVTCYNDIEAACRTLDTGSHSDENLNLTILRQGREMELVVGTDKRDGNGTTRAINWCGCVVQDPHSAVRALGFLPEEGHGVYVTRWCHGSPAHRYGLYALQWIVEVNGKKTPDLNAFADATKELEHGQFVRIRTVHLNGKPRVLTLKQDLHYWPTWELRFDPETALWRRNILKALK
uniref:PDZ domain-containing protein n=1 Tax=Brassica campestris TaxID=3711 RepID=M4DXW5_BRACM